MIKSFSKEQQKQLEQHGISLENAHQQALFFEQGTNYTSLNRPCHIKDGILTFSQEKRNQWIQEFENNRSQSLTHFIPASGVASRMFKVFYTWLERWNAKSNLQPREEEKDFLAKLPLFAFYPKIVEKFGERKDLGFILQYLLEEDGLNFGNQPKALIDFHSYSTGVRTALEEHILEALVVSHTYANLHFTVAKDHLTMIKSKIIQNKNQCQTYQCSFSTQRSETDTLAQDLDGNWMLNKKGSLLLRPGGHGSLLHNLNELQTELFFIKNIDNICHESHQEPTVRERKMIIGLLINVRKHIFKALLQIEEKDEKQQEYGLKELERLNNLFFCAEPKESEISWKETKVSITKKFNRPLRICGVVRNTGEPGGGPFWVNDGNGGEPTLQIVEQSQVNPNKDQQKSIFEKSTYFNPVFLAGNLVNHHQQKFNLLSFQDRDSYLITEKSQAGKTFRILEKPGLWNGAMARWNTIFVEVDAKVFNAVKEITDLLKEAHQAK